MLIDNFEEIEDFIKFEKGTFYKFEALVRNTDGSNDLYEDGYSNTNKNILIKSWYIDSLEYYQRAKKEMKVLCNMTGARLYMTCDRKSVKKFIQTLISEVGKIAVGTIQGTEYAIKTLSKLFASVTSKVESSDSSMKTLMFDIDTKDERVLKMVQDYLNWKSNLCVRNHVEGFYYVILDTVKGWHVIATKKFDSSDWLDFAEERTFSILRDKKSYERRAWCEENISMKPNQLCLVYTNN